MGVINAGSLVLDATGERGRDNPLIGWHNIVVAGNVTASTEDTEHPAVNLANPATNLKWQSGVNSGDEFITVVTAFSGPIDYLAIAKHNLGSAGITVSVETGDDGSPTTELVEETLLTDDRPVLFRFEPRVLSEIRLRMQPGTTAPEIAVLRVGELIVLPRRIYVGHTPIVHARKAKVVSPMSESGQFLGRVVTTQWTESIARLSLITPEFYREELDDFLAGAKTDPFFFAWRPHSYPDEIGYVALTNDPMPVNEGPSGLVALELAMRGVSD